MAYNMTIFEELHVEVKIWQGPKSSLINMGCLWVIGEDRTR